MNTYTIRGLQVRFPFAAYPCQLAYMERVIQCLQEKKNGALESPTGTGKTLCLLCASLAWQNHEKAVLTHREANGESAQLIRVPKIFYASRTHSQLNQTVQELKRCGYTPKVCILASRDQLCLNNDVQRAESNAAKSELCRQKVIHQACEFHPMEEMPDVQKSGAILDIEDLLAYGRENRSCPFYLARQNQTTADVIILPYNYLIDPKTRKAQNLDIEGHILIIDEAHNIEKVCEEGSSFEITAALVGRCANEIESLLDNADKLLRVDDEEVKVVKAVLMQLEMFMTRNTANVDLEPDKWEPGSYIFRIFDEYCKVNLKNAAEIIRCMQSCVSWILQNRFRNGHCSLASVVEIFELVFSLAGPRDAADISRFYRVYLQDDVVRTDTGDALRPTSDWDVAARPRGPDLGKRSRKISFWCFSPGFAMRQLMRLNIHSLILTSGTLSPIGAFTSELKIPFEVTLENQHVIGSNQVWAAHKLHIF